MRILVVDDVSYNTVMLEQLLRTEHDAVMTAHSVEQALSVLQEQTEPVDVVISDLMMPEEDGVALLHAVQKKHREREGASTCFGMPVFILLTASRDQAQIDAALTEGFVAVLNKPIDKRQLLQLLD